MGLDQSHAVGRTLLLVVVGVAMVTLTAARMSRWTSDTGMWAAGETPRALINQGVEADRRGDLQDAERLYQLAMALAETPGRSFDERRGIGMAEANLALVRWKQGRHDEALALVTSAHQRLPLQTDIEGLHAWMSTTVISSR